MRALIPLLLLAVACASPTAPETPLIAEPTVSLAELTQEEFGECQRQFRAYHHFIPQVRYTFLMTCLYQESLD